MTQDLNIDSMNKISKKETKLDLDTLCINITNKCNLSCIWCHWQKNKSFTDNGEITLDQFKKIIQVNHKKFKTLNMASGGEIFTHQSTPDMINYVKNFDPNIKIEIVTNALISLNPTIIDSIKNIDKFTVSVDGATKETYEYIRKPAKYDKLIKNLHNIANIKKEYNPNLYFEFVFTASKINIHELPSMIDFALKFDGTIDGIWAGPVVVTDKLNQRDSELELTNEDKNLVEKYLKEFLQKGKKHNILASYSKSLDFLNYSNKTEEHDISKCRRPWVKPPLIVDNYLIPCCFINPNNNKINELKKYDIGDPYLLNIKDLFNSEGYWKFRNDLSKGKTKNICGNCSSGCSYGL